MIAFQQCHRQLDFFQQFLHASITENIKAPHHWPLCEGNPPVTGGFPSQRASNEGSIPCHDNIITMQTLQVIFMSRMTLLIISLHGAYHEVLTILAWDPFHKPLSIMIKFDGICHLFSSNSNHMIITKFCIWHNICSVKACVRVVVIYYPEMELK